MVRRRVKGGRVSSSGTKSPRTMLNGDKDNEQLESSDEEEVITLPSSQNAKVLDTTKKEITVDNVQTKIYKPSLTYNTFNFISRSSSEDDDDGNSHNVMVEESKSRYSESSHDSCESDGDETSMLMPIDIQKMILGEGWEEHYDPCISESVICEEVVVAEAESVSACNISEYDSLKNEVKDSKSVAEEPSEPMEICMPESCLDKHENVSPVAEVVSKTEVVMKMEVEEDPVKSDIDILANDSLKSLKLEKEDPQVPVQVNCVPPNLYSDSLNAKTEDGLSSNTSEDKTISNQMEDTVIKSAMPTKRKTSIDLKEKPVSIPAKPEERVASKELKDSAASKVNEVVEKLIDHSQMTSARLEKVTINSEKMECKDITGQPTKVIIKAAVVKERKVSTDLKGKIITKPSDVKDSTGFANESKVSRNLNAKNTKAKDTAVNESKKSSDIQGKAIVKNEVVNNSKSKSSSRISTEKSVNATVVSVVEKCIPPSTEVKSVKDVSSEIQKSLSSVGLKDDSEKIKVDKIVTRSRSAGKTPDKGNSTSKPKKKSSADSKPSESNKELTSLKQVDSPVAKPDVKDKKIVSVNPKVKTPLVKTKKIPVRTKAAKKLHTSDLDVSPKNSMKGLGKLHIQIDNSSDEGQKGMPLKSKDTINLMSSVEKIKPMSPKELFKKHYNADINNVHSHSDSSEDKKLVASNKADNPTLISIADKTKPMSPKEMIKKNYCAEVGTDFNFEPSSKSSFADAGKNDLGVIAISDGNSGSDSTKDQKSNSDDGTNQANMQAPVTTIFDPEKPVKVKSRWRRTSELELVAKASEDSIRAAPPSPSTASPQLPYIFTVVKDDPVVLARMNSFVPIESNDYLTERSVSKETKNMVCDCTLSKEEINRGEKGCGQDCLNRLLFIECGSKCSLGNLCSNKRFINREYSKCEIVDTKNKGVGVVSSENLPSGHFIMEYIGEVLGPKEFKRRAKDYAKEKNAHFYFMALKSDTVIDATTKGNVSRFINHSCDPNAETQKWTVNGELRIGFFSKRPIAVGEEITFDYQLQRYGKEAQKCYCGSANCRGWLGEDPENDEDEDEEYDEDEEDDEEEDSSDEKKLNKDLITDKVSVVTPKKEKKKKIHKRSKEEDKVLGDIDLEEEIEKLSVTGLKNQKHTLALSRLMVRAEKLDSRSQLLDIMKQGDTRCLRLFLDYNGLSLILRWMHDPKSTLKLNHQILEILALLPILNKTILKDSKMLPTVEKWVKGNFASNEKERSSEEDDSNSPSENKNAAIINNDSAALKEEDPEINSLRDHAARLVATWALLKEEFRIPRKQRVEQMKEHEREANMGYSDPRENQSYYDRRRWHDRKESRFDRVSRFDKEKKPDFWAQDGPVGGNMQMSKAERRQLFALRVEQEDRERKEAERMWWSHKQQCAALGVDPLKTAMFHPPSGSFLYYHSHSGIWQTHPEGAPEDNFGSFDVNSGGGGYGVDDPTNSFEGPPPDHQFRNFPIPDGQLYNVESGNKRGPLLPTPPIAQLAHPSQLVHQGPPPPHQILPLHPPPLTHLPPPPQQGFPPFPPHQGPPLPPLPPQGQPIPQGPPLQGPPLPQGPSLPQGLPLPQGPPLPQCPPLNHSLPPPIRLPGPPPPLPPGAPVGPFGPPLLQPFSPMHQPPVMQPPLPQAPPNVYPQFQLPPAKEAPPPPPPLPAYPPPMKLPARWRAAKDKEGRTYYFHTKSRKSQWMFPQATDEAASDSSSAEEESESSEEDEEDEEEEESSSDNEQDANKTDDNELERAALKRKLIEQGSDSPLVKRANDNLVKINIIPRDEVEHVKGITKSKIRDNKEKVKREKLRARRRAEAGAAKCEADTSSVPQRRFKDLFRIQMADVVVACLSQYRKPDCKMGRITSTEDFKGLARKLTHFIMLKELKHCLSIKDLQCNDNVKHKARDFIRKYMLKFGPVYVHKDKD